MQAIYTILVFVSLTFIGIVIAIFVFASSFYKGALELSAKEKEDSLNTRKEFINRKKNELIKKIKGFDENDFPEAVRTELNTLEAELRNIEESITKARNKSKSLTVRNLVATPLSLLLIAIVISGVASVNMEALPARIWIAPLVLTTIGVYRIFRNLFIIESFSKVTDLGTLMEKALDRHSAKRQPIVDMDVWNFQLEIARGETKEIEYDAFLKQGAVGKNAKVQFLATAELLFPEEKVNPFGLKEKHDMKKPNYFAHKLGTINPKLHRVASFKVKAPDTPGDYVMSCLIQCDEYGGEERTFTIKVI